MVSSQKPKLLLPRQAHKLFSCGSKTKISVQKDAFLLEGKKNPAKWEKVTEKVPFVSLEHTLRHAFSTTFSRHISAHTILLLMFCFYFIVLTDEKAVEFVCLQTNTSPKGKISDFADILKSTATRKKWTAIALLFLSCPHRMQCFHWGQKENTKRIATS
jgi:hypothetical protein